MSYGSQTFNPWEHDESPIEDERTFPCPCGDPQCIGFHDDHDNLKIGPTWYAADCVMANHHPLVVEMRERDRMADERRGK